MGNKLFDELFAEHEADDDGVRISYRDYEDDKFNESFETIIRKSEFKKWEVLLTNAQGYPNNNESRLAIQTLKTCVVESPIDDVIAKNGYALFDYSMLCYFAFRARLCADFSRSFVELYDTYLQNLLSLYFSYFFNISKNTINGLIVKRAQQYESIVHGDNVVYELTATLTDYIEKDLEGIPEYDGVLITGIDTRFELHIKLFDSVSTTLNTLKHHAAILNTLEHHAASIFNTKGIVWNRESAHNHSTITKSVAKKHEAKPKQKEDSFIPALIIIATVVVILLVVCLFII